ncbi:Wzz/FepE/Etk N-terminal domain-containing protein [Bradyrhizobium septentrionale]|uniref:Wzz/FepE/Etk N-terminal domain-containing protein n=2 Tax=Bradyrhizobium septentrionale TaxID=1404411 RepID=A0ABZ2NUT7_9BRAD|nr:Wzz/FepE/Etk N-terminal domain-containing protein [Bradyrhizobium septentrionale]UGY17338.1 Wzz/FepE/Etk N-terminal domain-containing protein [Bradyrhizobium septentrionale]UGY26081.1 Wzz/FepE/Etk N-terminal domain-containing protein [Bradyrhizobium septentrionale]
MLQTHRTDSSAPQDMPPEFGSAAEFVADGLAFLRRRLSIILLTSFLMLGTALLYLVLAVPTFTATAQLIVDVDAKSTSTDTAAVTTAVESQIAILKSEGVARAVIAKLGLAEDREFSAGALHRFSQSTSRLLGWSRPETGSSNTRDAVEAFERKLSVRRAGLTYIVDLGFNSAAPDRAAQILSAIVESYITTQMDAKYKWGLQNEKWVKDRVSDLSSHASAAKKAVADYNRARNGVAAPAGTAEAGTLSSQSTGRTPDELRELEATADAAAKAYENFLRMLRYTDATQQQSPPVFEARLLTGVSEPYTASSPKARLVLGMAILGGILLGIGIGLLREWSDRRRAPARWSASGGTSVVQGLKAGSARPHLDGSFKVEKQNAYKEANPDL